MKKKALIVGIMKNGGGMMGCEMRGRGMRGAINDFSTTADKR